MASLHYRYSSMNAGKSTYLLQVAHNYEENGQRVELFTSARDDRDGVGVVASRIGLKRNARVYSPKDNFFELLGDFNGACVLVDEAQFVTPEQAKELHRWVHFKNIPVMCFGIRSDFRGDPFPGSAALLALADKVEEIKTVCACGKRATMNIRMDDEGRRVTEGDQVQIGGNNRYRQVCARCFYLTERPGASLQVPVSNREMALAVKAWWLRAQFLTHAVPGQQVFDKEPDFVTQARTVLGDWDAWLQDSPPAA